MIKTWLHLGRTFLPIAAGPQHFRVDESNRFDLPSNDTDFTFERRWSRDERSILLLPRWCTWTDSRPSFFFLVNPKR